MLLFRLPLFFLSPLPLVAVFLSTPHSRSDAALDPDPPGSLTIIDRPVVKRLEIQLRFSLRRPAQIHDF